MTAASHPPWRTRAELHAADGMLLVWRDPPPAPPPSPGQPAMVPGNPAEGPEILLAVSDDGRALALAGHVDLGTGLRTALAQLVAEELNLPLQRVDVILGDTAIAPNQGPTIASSSIQIHAAPLRRAAAQARAWLVAQAAQRWSGQAGAITAPGRQPGSQATEEAGSQGIDAHGDAHADAAGWPVVDGVIHHPDGRRLSYGDLLRGHHVEVQLDLDTPLKPEAAHQVVGQSLPRVDIPAKAFGESVFVHDMRLPGMLHGRVVRPPYAGVDAGDFVGRSLEAVDEASIAHIPGIVKLVVIADFIGIVARREEQAEAAMRALQVRWKPWGPLPPLHDIEGALRANPATPRVVAEQGDVAAGRAGAAQVLDRDYLWPYQLHASIGPSCALAHWQGDHVTVWAGTQNPHVLRADLARLGGLADVAVEVVRMEAAGCYGRNGADDVAADALLLSRAVGAPVRVQLSREQEQAWEPKGAAQWMQVRGGLNADGSPAAYDFQTCYPSNGAPTLALLLTATVPATAQAFFMGDRTSVPPYAYGHQRITVNDMAPILRASWLRGVSALPNSFAHESYIDELASAAGIDPVAYRLRYLNDARAAELVQATADKAGWQARSGPRRTPGEGDWALGQGFAYARYSHSKFPGFGAAWAAWVADVEVNRVSGEVHVSRVVVGHDAGLMVNPDGVRQQVHGNVLQTTSRALKERVELDPVSGAVASRDWGSYPILSFREMPVVQVMLMPRPGQAPLGVGESSSVPGTAAIANAIFDATGVRLRQPPFTPEVVRAALAAHAAQSALGVSAAQAALPAVLPQFSSVAPAQPRAASADPQARRKGLWATALALGAGLLGLAAAALGWRPAMAPVAASPAGVYSAALIERGRTLAALGNCATCHTAPGGAVNAGGRAMDTPFGVIHSTNLTPDAASGIGLWSFSAFQRALREGVSRDGRHLYPAFPYTAFTQASDEDLMALYAHLMSQPAVAAATPANDLRFPFSLRPLMALWNALYLVPGPVAAVPGRSEQWNRGAALVNGLGHCGACHTPRNALGAELSRTAYLGGALADGWEAPALGAASHAPQRWTEAQLMSYLRQGHASQHGMAGGPMAPVVRDLAQVAEGDLRAMAVYLASLQPDVPNLQATTAQAAAATQAVAAAALPGPAQRRFEAACGACHHDGSGPQVLGLNLPLADNSNLHGERPDNLLRTILQGIQEPAFNAIGHMPAFRDAMDDRQIAELAAYMRQRFAPQRPPWVGLEAAAARLRSQVR